MLAYIVGLLYKSCFFFLQLRAYAKVAQRNNEQAKYFANPDYKGYTLPQDAVMHYTDELWNTTRGQVGEGVFLYLYLLNILVTMGLLMYFLLSSTAYQVYDREILISIKSNWKWLHIWLLHT